MDIQSINLTLTVILKWKMMNNLTLIYMRIPQLQGSVGARNGHARPIDMETPYLYDLSYNISARK